MNKTYQEVCDELRVANERIAALSAHNRRLSAHARSAAEELALMIEKHNVQSESDGSWLYDHQTPCELMAVVSSAPGASLTRHNLLEKAEELEDLWSDTAGHTTIACGSLVDRARHLRKQAEEL